MIPALGIAAAISIVCGLCLMLAAFEVYEIDGAEVFKTDWRWLIIGFTMAIGGVVGITALLMPGGLA